jgi:transcription antitermination factor NusG
MPARDEISKTTSPSEEGEAMAEIDRADDSPYLHDEFAARSSERHWFAVYTTCRHEKRVAQHLERRLIEHYLPTYRSHRRWKDGSKVTLDLPLFPGYIFVHIHRKERVSVLEVPGVLWLVGKTGSQPTPLPEFEIETLRAGLDPLRAEPCTTLTAGQRVRIRAGALAGIEGIVVRQKNGVRVVLTLDLIMQSISVEVSAMDLEPLSAQTRADLCSALEDLKV